MHADCHSLPVVDSLHTIMPTFETQHHHHLNTGLELAMRDCSNQVRVVEKLAGGAHLLLPSSETTIAVRTYYVADLERLDKTRCDHDDWIHSILYADDQHDKKVLRDGRAESKRQTRLDGIAQFRDTFQFAVVFFVLPDMEAQQDHLGRADSFVNLVQFAMAESNSGNGIGGTNNKQSKVRLMVCIIDRCLSVYVCIGMGTQSPSFIPRILSE